MFDKLFDLIIAIFLFQGAALAIIFDKSTGFSLFQNSVCFILSIISCYLYVKVSQPDSKYSFWGEDPLNCSPRRVKLGLWVFGYVLVSLGVCYLIGWIEKLFV